MKNYLCLVFFVVALVVVALTAALLEPIWAHDLFLDGWNLEEQLFARQREAEQLTQRDACIKQLYAERMGAAQRLYDGRATLFETAATFQRLNRNRGNSDLRHYFPEASYHMTNEQVCREVIQWMAVNFKEDAAQLVPRLEEELRRHKERYGTVMLPEEPGT